MTRRLLTAAIALVIISQLAMVPTARAHSLISVAAYQQQYSLSCEFASLYIVTSYWGNPLSEDHALADTSWSANPHHGFRGDITGMWGSTTDYGIYAEPLAELARAHGYRADVSYGADANTMTTYLDQGIPVIVWASVLYEPGWYEYDENGNAFKIVPFTHVFVVNGYDEGGVNIADPGTGTFDYLTWDYFLSTWAIMDGMMLAVYPV